MAASTQRLNAHRLKLLTRVQTAREQRRRSDLVDAQGARDQAMARRDAADAALLEAAQHRVAQLRAHYDELATRTSNFTAIEKTRKIEEDLNKAQARKSDLLGQAENELRQAEDAVAAAARAYSIEAQRTRKRERMSDKAQLSYRQATIIEEEAALEDEQGDRLALLPPVTRA